MFFGNPEEEPEFLDLEEMIPANTVYRFTYNTASVHGNEKVAFSLFPNLVQDVLNITFEEDLTKDY